LTGYRKCSEIAIVKLISVWIAIMRQIWQTVYF